MRMANIVKAQHYKGRRGGFIFGLLIRPLNVSTVRAELIEAQAAFRQAQGERMLKLHCPINLTPGRQVLRHTLAYRVQNIRLARRRPQLV